MPLGRSHPLDRGSRASVATGGQLVFLTNSFLLTLCVPDEDSEAATERLLRPAFGMYRVEWPGHPCTVAITALVLVSMTKPSSIRHW